MRKVNYIQKISWISKIQMFTDEFEECDYIAGHMIKCIKKYMDLDEIFLVRSKLIKQYFELEDI